MSESIKSNKFIKQIDFENDPKNIIEITSKNNVMKTPSTPKKELVEQNLKEPFEIMLLSNNKATFNHPISEYETETAKDIIQFNTNKNSNLAEDIEYDQHSSFDSELSYEKYSPAKKMKE